MWFRIGTASESFDRFEKYDSVFSAIRPMLFIEHVNLLGGKEHFHFAVSILD
jgi:hypothetical protein